ncbi:leucine-rich repeat-containing protein 4C-like, partial [Chrysoperla carnea]|uniref:leucine-rich repeat-containing protein 4C-like n=1 Tax=Chrysoperla carnea TaxID=189513 RepID=UPI001D080E2D
NVQNNQIETISDFAFENLLNLKLLNLSNNNLQTYHEQTFKGLENLKILDLNNTGLKQFTPKAFFQQTFVDEFYVSNNNIRIINSNSFLDITNNPSLTSIEIGAFQSLSSLETLKLPSKVYHNIEKGFFDGLSSITNLSLTNCSIKYLNTEAFYVMNNNLTSIHVNAFESLSELTELNLSNNNLQVLNYTHLEPLNSLQHLDLRKNKFTDINIETLTCYFSRNLKRIQLENNNWSCDRLLMIIKHLSALHINFDPINPDRSSPNINGILCDNSTYRVELVQELGDDVCKNIPNPGPPVPFTTPSSIDIMDQIDHMQDDLQMVNDRLNRVGIINTLLIVVLVGYCTYFTIYQIRKANVYARLRPYLQRNRDAPIDITNPTA